MAKIKADKGSAPRKTVRTRKVAAIPAPTGGGVASATKPRMPRLPKAVAAAVRAARDKKAVDIVVLDLRKAGGFTDHFVICTGMNPRHINAVADGIDDTLRSDLGERPALAEGSNRSEWILLDYFDFVVHVFSRDCRAFYDLERLWGNAERFAVPDER